MDALLPLNPDLFYRERLWRRNTPVSTLEVTGRGESHFFLLDGAGEFDLPAAADYRLEAYHGTFFKPAVARFALRADQTQTVELEVEPLAAGRQDSWISADDHIHLMRAKEDNNIFLRWIEAEDLDVAHFLELERQQYAAVQYAFGDEGEARRDGQVIRSGHESRSRFYGHTLFLGPRKMIRPLSIGLEYANSPEAYPKSPGAFLARARRGGADRLRTLLRQPAQLDPAAEPRPRINRLCGSLSVRRAQDRRVVRAPQRRLPGRRPSRQRLPRQHRTFRPMAARASRCSAPSGR